MNAAPPLAPGDRCRTPDGPGVVEEVTAGPTYGTLYVAVRLAPGRTGVYLGAEVTPVKEPARE